MSDRAKNGRHRAYATQEAAWRTDIPATSVLHNVANAQKFLQEMQNCLAELGTLGTQIDRQPLDHRGVEDELAHYQRLHELAPVACYAFDRNGVVQLCNQRGADLLGRPMEKLLHQKFAALLDHDSQSAFAEFLQRTFSGDKAQSCDVRLAGSDSQPPRYLQIEAAVAASGKRCNAVAIDTTARKQATLSLQKEHEVLTNLSAQIPGILFQYRRNTDGSTHFPYVNASVSRLYRVSAEEAQHNAWTLSSMVHPEDAAGLEAAMLQSAHNLSPWRHEFRMMRPGQGVVWRAIEARPELLSDGSVLWHGYTIDISERKQIEEALRLSEERWKFALEGAGDGVWDWNRQTGEVLYSKRWKEILGFAEEEISSTPSEWLSRVHPDDKQLVITCQQRLIEERLPKISAEFRMRCKDGGWKWVLGSCLVVGRDGDGGPIRMVGTISDISERKQIEEALRISEERLHFAMEGTGEGVWDWNIQTGEATYSQRWKEILGYAEDEIADTVNEWADRIHPDDAALVAASQQAIFEGKQSSDRIEFRFRCRDGSWKWVLGSGILVKRDAEGKPLRMVGTCCDISERKQAVEDLRLTLIELEEKRREAELLAEAKSRFLNAASHDLRQPLYAIQLFADALGSESLAPKHRKTLHNLRSSIDAMSAQLQMLLDVSRLDMGNIQPQPDKRRVSDICDHLETTYAPIAQQGKVSFRVRAIEAEVYTDMVLITRLLGNLIDNAIKFAPRGSILVCARRSAAGIRLEVRDNGPGIPPEHQQRIFDEYYQIDNPARDPAAGLGLGLSIAQRIARLLQVPLAMRTQVGRGTVFSVTLPGQPPAGSPGKGAE